MDESGSPFKGIDNLCCSPPLQANRKRILTVDDEPIILGMYKCQLEACGYPVIIRTDSGEALEIFSKFPDHFELLITDYCMPKLNGDELSKRVLEIRPDLPIIMVTGYSGHFIEQHALSLGIKSYLKKPLDFNVLLEIMGKFLG